MEKIIVPDNYDYVGVYITNKCHLRCPYCITEHFDAEYKEKHRELLSAEQWVTHLNRFVLPEDVPITLQGGEPFVFKNIWHFLENMEHPVDIMTALPDWVTKEKFLALKTLGWNKREAPYPTIRVSWHKGQNDFRDLIPRIAELQTLLSIGLYYIEHPGYEINEIEELKAMANDYGIELRSKEFLGEWEGEHLGTYRYQGASNGKVLAVPVMCKNSVVPIGPNGNIYRCHSDQYFEREDLALGNVTDQSFAFPEQHQFCSNYGLCSECDVKVKTNHYQQYGYTSVDIQFLNEEDEAKYVRQPAKSLNC